MATYYRWNRSTSIWTEKTYTTYAISRSTSDTRAGWYYSYDKPSLGSDGKYTMEGHTNGIAGQPTQFLAGDKESTWCVTGEDNPNTYAYYIVAEKEGTTITFGGNTSSSGGGTSKLLRVYEATRGKGDFVDYVYSTSAFAYPNGGVSGDYYYDQRTTITSPTAPAGLTHPSPIVTPNVSISWTAATSNIASYPVSQYEVSYSTNGGESWTVAGNTTDTSYTFTVTPGTLSIMFRIRAKDSNGQWGAYVTGTETQVLLAPDLTVPEMVMQGQSVPVLWSSIIGSDSYTLQRKSSTDEDWVEVYSGANTSFSETAGTWARVQYRVRAVFGETPGSWAASAIIPVISASALVISGQDGDLGTLVNDVPYTVSTDTGNQIMVKTTVNGAVILDSTVPSGTAEHIPILDLVNGDGTIVIEASVQTASGTVSAMRTWTYDKAAITFPSSGSVAQLEKNGNTIWPKTLAECVRIPGGKTLDQVMGFPAQIFVSRYTGTGTYGSGDPNELTIPFKPLAVFVTSGNAGTTIPMVRPGTKAMNGSADLTVAWEDTGVSWYSTSAANQLNVSGTTYDVVALG